MVDKKIILQKYKFNIYKKKLRLQLINVLNILFLFKLFFYKLWYMRNNRNKENRVSVENKLEVEDNIKHRVK